MTWRATLWVLALAPAFAGSACRGRSATSGDATGAAALGVPGDITAWRVTPAPSPAEGGAVPEDALPMDADPRTARILCSSLLGGLFEIEWPSPASPPRVTRSWTTEALGGNPGVARYAGGGVVYVDIYQKGVAKLAGGGRTMITPAEGLINTDLLAMLVTESGDLWIAGVPGPFNNGDGGGVQMWRSDRLAKTVRFPNPATATLHAWIEVPERKSVFGATVGGVVEIGWDGSLALRSTDGAFAAISREPHGTAMGAVGSVVGRWDGQSFAPAFSGPYRPLPSGAVDPAPVGIAIDRSGVWMLLFGDEVLAAVAPDGTYLGSLDRQAGVPASPRRLLRLPDGERMIAGGQHGMALVSRR